MATKSAIVFPGQGSHTPEMRDLVAEHRPELLELAVREAGEDPFERAAESTRFAQPAIYCASLAGWAAMGRPPGDAMAGHSLGELGALVAAGALDEADGLRLVALRGRLMQEAGEQAGGGGMVVLLGRGAAEHADEIAGAHELVVANDNSPQQVVLSGHRSRLGDAVEHGRELGLRAMELDVTGAFHSPMMAAAVPEFSRELERVAFRQPRVPVISAVTVQPFRDPRRELVDALTMPVRWREVMLELHARGIERFVEVGPGRVLTGLAKRTLRDVELVNA